MNKTQLIILWIGAFFFLFCLWNPEDADNQVPCLLGVTVLTALLVYSYSDKNKDKFKEILHSLTSSNAKRVDTEKKSKE